MAEKQISVFIRLDNISGRDILAGILAFTDAMHRWKYRIFQFPGASPEKEMQMAVRESAGFILAWWTAPIYDAIVSSGKPVVYTSRRLDPRIKSPSALVRNDNFAIGKTGAQHLLSLGTFSSYAFVHAKPDQKYSQPRELGFNAELRSRRIRPEKPFRSPFAEGSDGDLASLADWLSSLPKPAAVMTACDWRALHILSAAERAGLRVPDQLAIVGVDNDELLVEHSAPPLTSVQPGHFEIGFTAARELSQLMNARRKPPVRTICVPPKRVVVRESTRILPPATTLVERAKKFIAERAVSGIGVEDVIAHLGCSRNLADLRYKAATGQTIHAAIEAARLEAVKHLLKTTRRPVAAIAAQCGFKSANRLTHLFRQRFGQTIRDWRFSETTAPPSARGRGKGGTGTRGR